MYIHSASICIRYLHVALEVNEANVAATKLVHDTSHTQI